MAITTDIRRYTVYSNDEIKQFVDIIAKTVNPDRIILFGSYAYGTPDDKSDLDLLVIKNDKVLSRDEHAELAVAVFDKRKQHKIGARYDIFFRTDMQVRESAEKGGAFTDALQKGKVVYERVHQ